MNINLNFEEGAVIGEGKNLWTVIYVSEDHEDSTVQLWLADDEEHLYEQVKSDVVGEEGDHGYEQMSEQFEFELWGHEIVFNKVATLG